jgi:hypothetical protein
VTTYFESNKNIAIKFISDWGTTTDVSYDNVEFDLKGRTDEWVRISVTPILSAQTSLGKKGDRKYQRNGLINIQVFTPLGENTGLAVVLSQQALEIFEGESFDGVTCNNGDITTIGRNEGWYQTNVSIDYNFIERK